MHLHIVKFIYNRNKIPSDLVFIEVNKAYEKLSGQAISDIIGKRYTELYPHAKKSLINFIRKYRSKVIMITAFAETKSVQDAIGIGCESYLSKPIDSVKLIELLRGMGLITDIAE